MSDETDELPEGVETRRRTRWSGLVGVTLARWRQRATGTTAGRIASTVGAVALTIAFLLVVTGIALALADGGATSRDDADVRITPTEGSTLSSVDGVEGPDSERRTNGPGRSARTTASSTRRQCSSRRRDSSRPTATRGPSVSSASFPTANRGPSRDCRRTASSRAIPTTRTDRTTARETVRSCSLTPLPTDSARPTAMSWPSRGDRCSRTRRQ